MVLVIGVIDSSGCKHYIHVFFSVNFRMPGIVVVMPDPDGEATEQCVSLADFYDPKFWKSTHPAVNHNNLHECRSFLLCTSTLSGKDTPPTMNQIFATSLTLCKKKTNGGIRRRLRFPEREDL